MMSTLSGAAVYLTSVAVLAILVKATLFLALGLCAVWLTRRARASVRHLLLAATFAAVIVLPFLILLGPAVSIEMRTIASNDVQTTASDNTTRAAASATPPFTTSASDSAADVASGAMEAHRAGRWRLWWRTVGIAALAMWLAGALVLILSTAIDLWRVRRIVRDGLPWPALQPRVAALAAQARLRRPVVVLRHEDVAAPFMCGLWQPAIVLPAAATSWSDEDLARALIHELEHVRRGDWISQCAARLACAGYWFHPLVWIAWRRLSLEAERTCDDAVVQRMEGTGYAEQLVVMAQHLSRAGAPAVLGMANRSDLASRVTAILDGMQQRGRAGTLRIATVISAALLVGVAIAPVRAVVAAPPPAAAKPRAAAASAGTPGVSRTIDATTAAAGAASEHSARLDAALVEAAGGGDLPTITALLDGGANVNAAVAGDGSPLLLAAREGHLAAVQLLLDRGADVNLGVIGDGNPLTMAAREGHLDIVTMLLDHGADVNLGVRGDGNALIMAAGAGHLEIVTLLLDRGASVDQVVPGDENALINASGHGQLDVVKLLVARGANVNARVWAPRTPTTGEWRTPLNMARSHRHDAVAAFLRSAGASE